MSSSTDSGSGPPALSKLPTECIQRIARHLWTTSPTAMRTDHHENPTKPYRQTQADMLHFALASSQMHACVLSELYAFPAVQSVRQAGLLLRTFMRHPELAAQVKSFRLGIDDWSPRSRPVTAQQGPLHDPAVGWTTTLRPRRGQGWWPEDSVVSIVAQLLQRIETRLNILVLDVRWLHFVDYFAVLHKTLLRLQPQELYVVSRPHLASQRGATEASFGRGTGADAVVDWFLGNPNLKLLNLGHLDHFPYSASSASTDGQPRKPLAELHFELRESFQPQGDPLVGLSTLFAPQSIRCREVRLNDVLVDPDHFLDLFPALEHLDLSVVAAPEDSDGSWAQPIDQDFKAHWRACNTEQPRSLRHLSIRACKLGDPSNLVCSLPSSVATLTLGLTTLDPNTLLLPLIGCLQQQDCGALGNLKEIRLDLSASPFEAARTRTYDAKTQRLQPVNEYMDVWHIFEPELRRLAAERGIGLQVLPGLQYELLSVD